jgi:hypothetical protein
LLIKKRRMLRSDETPLQAWSLAGHLILLLVRYGKM